MTTARLFAACVLLAACQEAPTGPLPDADERDDARAPVTNPAPTGFLHRAGTRVLDGSETAITLRGVNVGGWLNWEGWMWGSGYVSESDLLSRLTTLVGAERTAAFQSRVYDTFITEADFAEMERLGFNVVRLNVNHRLLEDDANPMVMKESGFTRLDGILDAAERHGLYVIIDLHSAPCGQSNVFTNDPDQGMTLFDDETCQARTVAWWKAVAARYADRTIVGGYDLLNEPAETARLVALYRRIIDAIREVDRHHLVVLEGATYSSDFSIFSGRMDENQLYGAHHYFWGQSKTPGEVLAGLESVATRDDTPMWVGEMGLSSTHQPTADQVDMEEASSLISGWCYWSWKFSGESRWSWLTGGNQVLRGLTLTPAWKEVAAYLGKKNATPPSADVVTRGLDEFIESVKLENTRFDPLTADALRPELAVDALVGNGEGLTGHYFQGTTLINERLARVDPQLDFDWKTGAPAGGLQADDFSVRWSGQLEAPRSEWFIFRVDADDGVRLTVNGAVVIDGWTNGSLARTSAPLRFTAGQKVEVTLEYFEAWGSAHVQLGWESARTAASPIGTTQLYPRAAQDGTP